MSTTSRSYAAATATSPLAPWEAPLHAVGAHDVAIEVLFCGICHSDIHTARGEWPGVVFPVVPGHEIVGKVTAVGNGVHKFKVGDTVGVGCMVDSCHKCTNCSHHLEQFCSAGSSFTYNSTLQDKTTRTYGGYTKHMVVSESFVLHVSDKLDLAKTAPLLCAGITTYSPLRYVGVKKGDKVGVVGLGGLGHMAVKFAHAMGAEVTMLSTSASKEADARKLGAHKFALTTNDETFKTLGGYFNVIIDTISAKHDLSKIISLLAVDGTVVLVGAPPEPHQVPGTQLIFGRKKIMGSLIGGVKETQEMLDFCAEHNITSDIEIIPADQINAAYERVLKSDVKYRFVIDVKNTL